MRDLHDFGNRATKAVHEAHMSQRNDQGITIHQCVIGFHPKSILLRLDKDHVRSARTLGQPDVSHGGKFKFAKHDLVPLLER